MDHDLVNECQGAANRPIPRPGGVVPVPARLGRARAMNSENEQAHMRFAFWTWIPNICPWVRDRV